MANILISECLQNDFVAPIDRFDALPNALHIGYEEARRLMGERPDEGPIARIMTWAYAQQDARLRLFHMRDWHDARDPAQRSHLDQFGAHCIANTQGAEFAFDEPAGHGKDITVISTQTLNNFQHSDLHERLENIVDAGTRIGIVGVWSEAKLMFLAYELRSRFPQTPLAVCSALTASESRHGNIYALDLLHRILGVEVLPSLGAYLQWLGGDASDAPLLGVVGAGTKLALPESLALSDTDLELLRYLFRDAREARFRVLDGGYSGNVVLASESEDLERRQQVPHVIKIGARDPIHRERESFERVEAVLGNAAPRIADFADLGDRAALKYRYASMHGGARTLQAVYMDGLSTEQVNRILDIVFLEQLDRLYSGLERHRCDILEYYEFSDQWADSVREKVEALIGHAAHGDSIVILPGIHAPNLCEFYDNTLSFLPRNSARSWQFATVHGDLNGANIVLDANQNVWLIDFFHTHHGHVLKDLIKLENDLLYLWTPLQDEHELRLACRLTDVLLDIDDLRNPAPAPIADLHGDLLRAFQTATQLRSYYHRLVDSDRNPLQLFVGLLRYAVHTLGFEEASELQRRWALYAACRLTELVSEQLRGSEALRVDWIALHPHSGALGLTILPGRQDFGRNLQHDLTVMRNDGVTHIVTLLDDAELSVYGVRELPMQLGESGFEVHRLPILDQKICGRQQAAQAVDWITAALAAGWRVVIHCAGGLGRSGMIAACVLKHLGHSSSQAIDGVRQARSSRAIETLEQEQFVKNY